MLLAEPIAKAAHRWLKILKNSSLATAWALLRSNSAYADLTHTQYAVALEWLREAKMLVDKNDSIQICNDLICLSETQVTHVLYERMLEIGAPLWLPDSDILIVDTEGLPQDAVDLADTLAIDDSQALLAIKRVHGKIDLERRSEIGSAGEAQLVRLLEDRWPGSTQHVALYHDGFGYDISLAMDMKEWHVEVKSTIRRGRLIINLSRNEYEVGLVDPFWRLVVVGLNSQLEIEAIATVSHREILNRSPQDSVYEVKWQSASYQLSKDDLTLGLSFLNEFLEPDDFLSVGRAAVLTRGIGWLPNTSSLN